MDIFDKYIFDEVVELYGKESLSEDEYVEIYHRLLGIEYIEEVQPYLYTMRYFGWGTRRQSEEVLDELRDRVIDGNYILAGIYYDLLLCKDETNEEIKEKLYEQEENGYTDKFLKGESHVKNPSGKFQKKRRQKEQIQKNEKKFSKYSNMINNAFMSYEDGKLEDAERIFSRILMGDISCAEAYLGMMLFSEGKKQEEYHAKFIRYASEDMRELETVLITPKITEKFLDMYIDLQDRECFKKVIELHEKEIPFHAMYLAVEKFNDTEMLEFLLEQGANPNSFRITKSKYGEGQESILDICTRREENIEKVRLLLKYGADTNFISKTYTSDGTCFQMNALCRAIRWERLEIVKLLLKNGIDVNSIDMQRNQYGESRQNALVLAIWAAKDLEMVRILLENGVDVNYISKWYTDKGAYCERNALCEAIRYKQLETVKLLLKNGIDVNCIDVWRDQNGESRQNALELAVWAAKDLEMVRALLQNGVDFNYINKGYYSATNKYYERTVLITAIQHNQFNIVRVLLKYGADVNSIYIEEKDEYSILGYCILKKKDFEIIRLLVENGADVNYVDKWYENNQYYERYILSQAIADKQLQVINLLLQHGANMSQVYTFTSLEEHGGVECKGSALFFAVMGTKLHLTDLEMIETLLQSESVLDEMVIFDGKEYIMRKFPINKFKIHERILSLLKKAGWKGEKRGFFR